MAADDTEIKELLSRAAQARAAGELPLARSLLTKVLGRDPAEVTALYRLGRLELEAGEIAAARSHLTTALRHAPNAAPLWEALMDVQIAAQDRRGIASVLSAAGRAHLPAKLRATLKAKAEGGNKTGQARIGNVDPAAFQALVAAFQSKNFAQAREDADVLVATHGHVAPVLAVRAAAEAALGETAASEASYTAAIAADPDYPEARLQLAQVLMATGRADEALPHLVRAQALIPQAALVRKLLGLAHEDLSRPAEALVHLTSAAKALPQDITVALARLRAAIDVRKLDQAEVALAALAAIAPDAAQTQLLTGVLRVEQGQFDAAEAALRASLAATDTEDHRNQARIHLANLFQRAGDFDAARRWIAETLAADPGNGAAFRRYVSGGKITADDPTVAKMQALFDAEDVPEAHRIDAAFGLAKAFEDRRDYAQAFRYMRAGNDTARARFQIGDLASIWDGFELTKRALANGLEGVPAPAPAPDAMSQTAPRIVFVAGMPRSGTTLVESIIASHSQVSAGDELGLYRSQTRAALDLAEAQGRDLGPKALRALGAEIAAAYAPHAAGAPVLTDKAIFSFNYLGLMPHILPNARMIVVRRDPRDNCLSIYKNRFRDRTHRYSTDLVALGQTYLRFLDVLAYWRREYPGLMVEVHYEDLIAEPEVQARRIIAAAGLDWEDACLEFYAAARKVKTLSNYQVRQPIYSSSVGAWRHYEDELAPLLQVLKDGGALDGS